MTEQVNRLEKGGQLNRTKSIRFWYDDKAYEGYPGDTLASALLANGVYLVGRSFKYHRPRGIYSAGSEEPNALVQLETGAHTEPNRRATEIELYEGLCASSQNCWPSVNFDLGAINSRLSRILPAGFYYKTFMWPGSLWMTYEKLIRKSAGLGKSPKEIDPANYDKTFAHCDVLVVGGGPAGIQAAYAAGSAGAKVMLLDEKNEFGGSLLSDTVSVNDRLSEAWVAQRVSELKKMEQVTLLRNTTVSGYFDYNFLVANQRVNEHLGPNNPGMAPKERLWKIRARQVVLATGAIERPLVFADSDRPGVMLAGAIRTYINRFGVLPGKNIVILTNNDSAYLTAIDAKNVGAHVQVVDVRQKPASELVNQAKALGIDIIENSAITGVDYGKGKIRKVEIMSLNNDGSDVVGLPASLVCNVVGVAGGWNPTVHLFSQAKGKLKFLDDQHCFVPEQISINNSAIVAGACRASYTLNDCLTEGFEAGCAAAKAAGFNTDNLNSDASANELQTGPLRPLWILPCDHPIGRGKKKHFHELHNDSTVADIELAAREGFESVEHLKRYTTTGMGTDQGKTSNLNAMTVMANLRNVTVPEVGTTTFRPPFTPLTFGSIVGHDRRELFLQKRKTAIHPWHDKNGAVYEDVGDWKRPYYFPKVGESMHDAVQRECLAARNSCALLDASTLGKIDLQGKDTIKLLNMLYTNAWNQLAPGRSRYGLMLNEHGMVFDDGVTTCLAENHYHMTTTSGGAARVMNWIEEWLQTEWPEMKVYATSVTEQWAVASLNGPNSRKLLGELTELSLDSESFPFMSMKEAKVADIPARIYRISFTGELAFEINVPARYGLALWEALMETGKKYDICPYGTEAMHVLRAEKGFIIVGQDTDGTTTPMDLGMDWIVSNKKQDFLGKRSFARTDTARPDRKQLVGLLTEDPKFVLPEGVHVVEALKSKPPMDMLGHVSSSYLSPNVGRSIALALIKEGFNRKGQTLDVALMDGASHRVRVTDPVFFDKQSARSHD
ncbi:sarcosine oxidase subunit alpha family protein [Candidatus Spongiihabitans sp.]|uniref:sarcosine oxidase subunit alpha family protein n=1 Tax=Candidatus Spongiihabitans sp. TaxID=3101308 RepID=UPI003C6F4DC6